MTEINFAERETYMQGQPELKDCRRMGSTHKAYGWAPSPWGHWTEDRKAAYMEGYRSQQK